MTRVRVRRLPTLRFRVAALAAATASVLLVDRIGAEDGATGPRARGWEPALALGFGVHAQDLRGSQSVDFAELGEGKQGNLRFSFSEAEAVLFSPTLTETLGGLRLFVRGGGQLPFTDVHLSSNTRTEFNRGVQHAPEIFDANCGDLPDPVPPRDTPVYSAAFCSISGRNEMIANGSLFAGLGFDLTLPLGSYQFHLRPSINWFGQSLKGEGLTTRLTTAEETINCPPNSPTRNGQLCHDAVRPGSERYELEFSQAEQVRGKSGEHWMHGLGPRLELDIEVARVGNFVVEFFAQSGIYWILTDREIEYSGYGVTGSGTCRQTSPPGLTIPEPDLCSPPVEGGRPLRSFYRSTAGPVVVQGGGGFRVVWKGFSL